MSLGHDDREEIARLVRDGLVRLHNVQRREYIRLSLMLFESIQRLNDDFRPTLLAVLRRGLVTDDDVASAENALAAELAAHPAAEDVRHAIEELRRIAEELDREATEGAEP